jgi:hypothetical protein
MPKSPVGEITVTVDLRRAVRSFAAEVRVMTTYLDEATSRRHDGHMVTSLTSVSLARTHLPVGDHTVAIGDMLGYRNPAPPTVAAWRPANRR